MYERIRTWTFQGVNVFWIIWRTLFSLNTRFEIRPFALLPTLRQFSYILHLLFVSAKVLVFIKIEVKLPMLRNNLFEQINLQWDCIVPKHTCFQLTVF